MGVCDTAVVLKAGRVLKAFAKDVSGKLKAAKRKAREYRLFAKTKEHKDEVMAQMADIVEAVQMKLGKARQTARSRPASTRVAA